MSIIKAKINNSNKIIYKLILIRSNDSAYPRMNNNSLRIGAIRRYGLNEWYCDKYVDEEKGKQENSRTIKNARRYLLVDICTRERLPFTGFFHCR